MTRPSVFFARTSNDAEVPVSWRTLTPVRLTHALANRAGRYRNEMRARRQRLHNYAPYPALVTATTQVPAAAKPAVDVHNHLGYWLNGDQSWMVPDVGALIAAMDELNVATIVNLDGRWGAELEANLNRYDRQHPGRFATFCQLDWSLLSDARFPTLLLDMVRRAVNAGACGIKVWKDLGLKVRDASKHLVQPDDPRLGDVWELAAELNLPVLIHTADPAAFWTPLDRHNERFEELARHPEWHHGSRAVPSHQELLRSLERLLAAHRDTTFIGAHVASSAHNLERVAQLLADHPNFVVDLAACEAELGRQPRAAIALLVAHADRVLWGTDSVPFEAERYRTWFRLLESADECFPYSPGPTPEQGRWTISGLDLPAPVLTALYADNARRLIPALRESSPSDHAPRGGDNDCPR
ncbi:MAG: amidohydrolase family protein [Pseudonocardia sp.]